jgi:polysaccharide export outer membrane protein
MAIRHLLPVAILVVAASCAAEPSSPIEIKPEIVKSLERYKKEYVVSPGDQLEVSIFQVPELSKTVTVRADGDISLPGLKEVRAAGLTVAELDDDLARRYAGRVVNPEVTVMVLNPRAGSVYVVGEVVKPGPVPVRDAPTVAAALATSGGIARSAALGKVAVIRLAEDGYLTGYVVDNPEAGESAFYMAMSSMLVQPGDVVVVPENGRSQFTRFVQDFVNTPLTGVNQILTPYFNFRILNTVTRQ